ncbi:MAG: hypothetical protein IJW08_04655, partial [Lentisphaeria bacterium]|nr:hypothetical protein [Lentisphaeria bacterium]
AHCGQSRALLLCCFGHVQSYTPCAARAQNTTLTHTASVDANERFAFCRKSCGSHISHKSGLYQIKKFPAFLERVRGARGEREKFFSR